jgi:hypothetical protein
MKFFTEREMVRFHGKNAVFIKIKNIDNNDGFRDVVNIDTTGKSIQQLTISLYHELLKKRQRSFNFAKEINHDLTTPSSYKQRKRANKIASRWERLKKLPGERDFLRISMTTIAKTLNCSKAKAHGIIKALKREIEVYAQKVVLATRITKKMAKQLIEMNPGAYYFRGSVIKNQCNLYVF